MAAFPSLPETPDSALPETRSGPRPQGGIGRNAGAYPAVLKVKLDIWPSVDLVPFLTERLESQSRAVYAESLELMERTVLTAVLRCARGNQSEASRVLGITRGSLRHKIRVLGISIGKSITARAVKF
ncbi:MAG TPA: helix-turn-helix domain-containing protein [Pirellulaceae bacterium]